MKNLQYSLIAVCLVSLVGCHAKSNSEELNTLKSRVSSLEQQVAMLNQAIAKSEEIPQAKASESLSTGTNSSETASASLTGSAPAQPAGAESTASAALTPIEIQKALQNAGYYRGTPDGRIGPKTIQAIKDFQTENGLIADGKIGKKTSEKLRAHL